MLHPDVLDLLMANKLDEFSEATKGQPMLPISQVDWWTEFCRSGKSRDRQCRCAKCAVPKFRVCGQHSHKQIKRKKMVGLLKQICTRRLCHSSGTSYLLICTNFDKVLPLFILRTCHTPKFALSPNRPLHSIAKCLNYFIPFAETSLFHLWRSLAHRRGVPASDVQPTGLPPTTSPRIPVWHPVNPQQL